MTRAKNDHALFYSRDSGGRHETTPGQYVEWSVREIKKLGLKFNGSPDTIESMIRQGRFEDSDIYFDCAIAGNKFERPALNALMARCAQDERVSHVFIPARERLARPDDPIDAVKLERCFQSLGITICFQGTTVKPLVKGQRPDVVEVLMAVLAYDQSGKFRLDLAGKIIPSKVKLARGGFSAGGRPNYGFRRWLVHETGELVRQLADGERVRMAGHHVVWLPGPEDEIRIGLRIRQMLHEMPATRVTRILNEEGVPTPDSGRMRTDNGVLHSTSGVWHVNTVVNIARNPLWAGLTVFNRRGMGDGLRLGADGPRNLDESDFRVDDMGKEVTKVVINSPEVHITAKAHCEALVTPEDHAKLMVELDKRGATQKGKPRSRNPDQNPLGGRIFDLNCTWPMYRIPVKNAFTYKCGLYTQSHGAKCDHNHVDGIMATKFVLGAIRQKLSGLSDKLEARLRGLAERDASTDDHPKAIAAVENKLTTVRAQLTIVSRNMAHAAEESQFRAISSEFNRLKQHEKTLEADLIQLQAERRPAFSIDDEVKAALELVGRLAELSEDPANMPAITRLVKTTNARLFLRFQQIQPKKRIKNVVTGGVLAMGSAPAPIEVYQGPTARHRLAVDPEKSAEVLSLSSSSGLEGVSLGNVNRGDRI